MTAEIQFDPATNVATLGGASLVFHCHFYNCALQKAIEEGMGEGAADLLESGAATVVRDQLTSLGASTEDAVSLFRMLGFGMLDLSGVSATGGTASIEASHYAMGWVTVHGERDTPACLFPAGFIRGAVSATLGLELSSVRVQEASCFACGAETCTGSRTSGTRTWPAMSSGRSDTALR